MPRSSIVLLACALLLPAAARARQPAELAGPWELAFDRTGTNCRVLLRGERSDKGDFFLGMPTACRHAMPGIAAVGRWSMPDETHLVMGDPGGARLLTLDAVGDGFVSAGPAGTFTLTRVQGANVESDGLTPAFPSAMPVAGSADASPALLKVATRRTRGDAAPPTDTREDLAGRYAVMREKRDTGCMITLDKARAASGDRAQLAPGCRDQGIVIFDPASWQLVKGELVLTARAGHKARLEKQGEGQWVKDAKDGGKPLGLKRL